MPPENENLIELLGPREVIGQAIALLMDANDVNRDTAFEMLVQDSSDSHQRVRDSAARIVEQSDDRPSSAEAPIPPRQRDPSNRSELPQ